MRLFLYLIAATIFAISGCSDSTDLDKQSGESSPSGRLKQATRSLYEQDASNRFIIKMEEMGICPAENGYFIPLENKEISYRNCEMIEKYVTAADAGMDLELIELNRPGYEGEGNIEIRCKYLKEASGWVSAKQYADAMQSLVNMREIQGRGMSTAQNEMAEGLIEHQKQGFRLLGARYDVVKGKIENFVTEYQGKLTAYNDPGKAKIISCSEYEKYKATKLPPEEATKHAFEEVAREEAKKAAEQAAFENVKDVPLWGACVRSDNCAGELICLYNVCREK